MSKKTEDRWLKWDKMMNDKKYVDVVNEFDKRFFNNERIVIGDMIRRDDCLKALGVAPIREYAIYQRGSVGKRKPEK